MIKNDPFRDLLTALYRAYAQIQDRGEVLNWYLTAGHQLTEAELLRLSEARTQLLKLLVG